MKRLPAPLLAFATLTTLALNSVAAAFDWPQWRGPNRDDLSKETGLLKSWPAGGPKKVWTFENAGFGYSGVAISNGKLFTMGARDATEFLIAVDANTGKELWASPVGDRLANDWGDGPRGTPTVDGDRIYALGGQGTLICAQAADGKQVWKKTMQDLGGSKPNWGYTESVLVDGDKVICTPGGPKGTVAALNKANGQVAWQSSDLKDPAQYASVIAVDHNGARQYIQLTMTSLVGLDSKTGKVLWRSDWPGKTAVISTPIFNNGHVYITAGYGVGNKLVKVGPGNQVSDVYFNKVMKNHHGGVILLDGHIYGHSDGYAWVCQKFDTGEEVWAHREFKKGAIAYADGMFYCLDETSGALALVEASTKGWNEKGHMTIQPQSTQRAARGKIWMHPVISNGKLYLRDQEIIVCHDVKSK